MPSTIQATVRIDDETAARLDALAERMGKRPEFQAFRMTRSALVRMATLRGLEALEAEYPAEQPKRRRKAG